MLETLDDNAVNTYILEILSAQRVFFLDTNQTYYLFKYPIALERLQLDCLEKQLALVYKKEGFTSEEDLTEDIRAEFFSTEDQDQLEQVESKIKAYKFLMKKRIKGSIQYLEDCKKLSDVSLERDLIVSKKSIVKSITAEYQAREDKYYEMVSKRCLTLDGQIIWKNRKDLLTNIQSLPLAEELLNEYLRFYFGFDNKVLRKIARHPIWRNYYINSERANLDLFSSKTEDLSSDQLRLLSWSNYYYDIYQLSPRDRPSEDILEDDDALDNYLEEYNRKTKAEIELERQKSKTKDSKALQHNHSVVTPESGNFVSFHKQGMYSDPKEMSGGNETTGINEGEQIKEAKRKLAKVNSK